MSNRYGPWATMIEIGGSPQLSTFWRRRLTMLAAVSQTSFALSRRNLLWLGAATLLLMALPTIHFAAAGEEGASGAKGSDTAAAKSSDKATLKAGAAAKPQVQDYAGWYTVTTENDGDASGYLRLPLFAYVQLQRAITRTELKITPDQEKKLAEISHAFIMQEQAVNRQIRKEFRETEAGGSRRQARRVPDAACPILELGRRPQADRSGPHKRTTDGVEKRGDWNGRAHPAALRQGVAREGRHQRAAEEGTGRAFERGATTAGRAASEADRCRRAEDARRCHARAVGPTRTRRRGQRRRGSRPQVSQRGIDRTASRRRVQATGLDQGTAGKGARSI